MAYATTAKILGDTTTYQLSPNVKKYSLRDTGFIETKGGKFQLERSLDPASPFKGFKGKDTATNQEQLEYILADLVARNVIEKA